MLLQDPKNEADDLDDFTEPNKVDCEPLVDSSSSSLIFTIFFEIVQSLFLHILFHFIFWRPQFDINKLAPIRVFSSHQFSVSHTTHTAAVVCSAYLKAARRALVLFMKTKGPPLSSVFCRCLDHAVFQMAAAS